MQYARADLEEMMPLPVTEVNVLAAEAGPEKLASFSLDGSARLMHDPVPHWALFAEVKVTKRVTVKLEATIVQQQPLKDVRRYRLQNEIHALQAQLAELDLATQRSFDSSQIHLALSLIPI